MSGKIVSWRGSFGWIQPTAPLNHPEAQRRGGKVYLSVSDAESEIGGVGSTVTFFVYSDGNGLGAMHCRPADGPGVAKPFGKPPVGRPVGAKPGGAGSAGERKAENAGEVISGTIVRLKGSSGFIKPSEDFEHPLFKNVIYVHQRDMLDGAMMAEGMEVTFQLYSDSQGLGAEQVSPSEASFESASSSSTAPQAGDSAPVPVLGSPREPAGPRERIGDIQIIGEIIEWRGTFGWIQPSEPVDHVEAAKRRGRVYVHAKDCVDPKFRGFAPGDLVQFFCYADGTGLGAEECSAF